MNDLIGTLLRKKSTTNQDLPVPESNSTRQNLHFIYQIIHLMSKLLSILLVFPAKPNSLTFEQS